MGGNYAYNTKHNIHQGYTPEHHNYDKLNSEVLIEQEKQTNTHQTMVCTNNKELCLLSTQHPYWAIYRNISN